MFHGHSIIVLDPTAPLVCYSPDLVVFAFWIIILRTYILVSHVEVGVIMLDIGAEKVLSRHIKFRCQHEV